MASISVRQSKDVQDRHRKQLADLLRRPENHECMDCRSRHPSWASINLGIFICIRCSGLHRQLGVHISQVRSCTMDLWEPEQIAFMKTMGNGVAKKIWEATLPADYGKPSETENAELVLQWLRTKYERKLYYRPPGSGGNETKDAVDANTSPTSNSATTGSPGRRLNRRRGDGQQSPITRRIGSQFGLDCMDLTGNGSPERGSAAQRTSPSPADPVHHGWGEASSATGFTFTNSNTVNGENSASPNGSPPEESSTAAAASAFAFLNPTAHTVVSEYTTSNHQAPPQSIFDSLGDGANAQSGPFAFIGGTTATSNNSPSPPPSQKVDSALDQLFFSSSAPSPAPPNTNQFSGFDALVMGGGGAGVPSSDANGGGGGGSSAFSFLQMTSEVSRGISSSSNGQGGAVANAEVGDDLFLGVQKTLPGPSASDMMADLFGGSEGKTTVDPPTWGGNSNALPSTNTTHMSPPYLPAGAYGSPTGFNFPSHASSPHSTASPSGGWPPGASPQMGNANHNSASPNTQDFSTFAHDPIAAMQHQLEQLRLQMSKLQ